MTRNSSQSAWRYADQSILDVFQINSDLPEPDVARKWLAFSMDESMAEKADALPQDLKRALYGEILVHGPAGREIVELFSVMGYPKKPSDEELAVRAELIEGFKALNHHLETLWECTPDMEAQHPRFYTASWDVVKKRDDDDIFLLLCWILTSRYLLPERLAQEFGSLVEPTTKLFTAMGVPHLAWDFSRMPEAAN